MSQPVTIENDHLRLDVWPQFGGKVSALVDKSDHFDLLSTYAQELPTRCQYDMAYADAWYGGWDECFPAMTPSVYPLHPYQGAAVPDRGESWALPTTAVPTKNGITTVWHGLRFGYRLTRKLYLDGSSAISEYTLINLAPFEFRFAWGMGAMLSVASPVEVQIGDKIFPRTDQIGENDLHMVLDSTIQSPALLKYPERNRSLEVSYSSINDIKSYWRVKLDSGHAGGRPFVGVSPLMGRSESLSSAIADHSAATLAPSGRTEWRVMLRVG